MADETSKVSEAEWQQTVLDLARFCGWIVAHFRPARYGRGDVERWVTPVAADGKGFPDLVLVHPQVGVLFRELKSDTGRLSAAQTGWLKTLEEAGADVGVWRPSDWPDVRDTLMASRKHG